MKLSECKYGVLVQKGEAGPIGMVVGITNNAIWGTAKEMLEPHRAIPLVHWQDGDIDPVHHENIKIFEE